MAAPSKIGVTTSPTSVSVSVVVVVVALLSFLVTTAAATLDASSSCQKTEEVFSKRIGVSQDVPTAPVPDASLSYCYGTLEATNGYSCCTKPMEEEFLLAAPEYLKDQIQASNEQLKTRITHSQTVFKEHLLQSLVETSNKTSATLSQVFQIPARDHQAALDAFLNNLEAFFMGSDRYRPEEIVVAFFADLFPPVYRHVLSNLHRGSAAFQDASSLDTLRECLTREYSKVDPFGTVPSSLGKHLKYAMQRTRVFLESLDVLLSAVEMANERATRDYHCSLAVTRLQFCSMCSGDQGVRPCRGLCLNVMRGCLSKVSEVSSVWDDLVVAFQNLQMGMFSHHNAQEMLAQLDVNVTEAIMKAIDERSRIHTEVMSLCEQPVSQAGQHGKTRFSVEEGRLPQDSTLSTVATVTPAYIARAKSIRGDLATLVKELEESKGFLLRLPDNLCRVGSIYDQVMDSERCWNGSAVGRYMHSVPEENIISQLKHNKEVKVTLIADRDVIHVKEKLEHMRRNLSSLLNEEMMLSDESYRRVEADIGEVSGSGYYGSSLDSGEILVGDDEDFSYGYSGSGSGDSGTDSYYDEKSEETPTETTGSQGGSNPDWKPDVPSKGSDSDTGSRPGQRPPKSEGGKGGKPSGGSNPSDSAATTQVSFTLLLFTTLTTSWLFLSKGIMIGKTL